MKKIAVIGVEEGLGREVLNLLAEQGIKAKDVAALEPRSALGNMVSFGEDEDIDVLSLDGFDFKTVKTAVFAVSKEVAKKYIPSAIAAGVKIIDCSSSLQGEPDVPMIICGINDDEIAKSKRGIISVPSADVTQMLIPLQNLHKEYQIKRLIVSTYTSTSSYGHAAMDELFNQTRRIFMNDTLADDKDVFHKQIAFNVIPHIGDFIGEETLCEWEFNAQSKQVLGPQVKVHANCAVIPAFIGSAQYVNVEFAKEVEVDKARELIKKVKGVVVFDKQTDGGYVTLNDVQGENDVYISRLRQDNSVDSGISFWCVADNMRVAAGNILSAIKLFEK